jgi:hypothetical protein
MKLPAAAIAAAFACGIALGRCPQLRAGLGVQEEKPQGG